MNRLATARPNARQMTSREGMVVANRRRNIALKLIFLTLGSAFALYPVLIVIGASFDPRNTLVGARIIPANPSLANYELLFSGSQTPIARWLVNSVVVSGLSTLIVLTLTTLAAYS